MTELGVGADGHQLAFCGGSDIQIWETGDKDKVRDDVFRLLSTGIGGGLIFQSDHSVSSRVSGRTYDYIVNLVRECGKYPLILRGFDCHERVFT